MLEVLDTLDRHNFHKVETDSSLDTLYDKIFSANLHKDGNEVLLLLLFYGTCSVYKFVIL